MAGIILPHRWKQQPQGVVEVAADGLGAGIQHALSFSNNYDAKRKVFVPVVSDAAFRLANNQRGVYLGTTNSADPNRFVISNPYHPGASNFTVGIYLTFLREGANNDTAVVGVRPALGPTSTSEWSLSGNFAVSSTDYKPGFAVTNGATNYLAADTEKRYLNTPIVLVGQKIGTTFRLWRDGRMVGENTGFTGTMPTSTSSLKFGEFGVGAGSYNLNADLHCFAMWNRALHVEEIEAWAENPWQIFRPITRRIYFDAGAVPAGFNAAWAARKAKTIGAGVI